MRIGFTLPQFGRRAHRANEVPRFARRAEELGAASLWVGDRLLAPVNPTVGYAGTDTIPEHFRAVLDPLALLAAAAAVTERVRLGGSVINAPWYPPALFARCLTTIDQLSGGRLLLGFGTGWSPEEYQAAGVPMDERGRYLDECLDILEAFWTTNPVEYHGRFWTIPATYADLKPAQQPRPPVYLAGTTPAALRRIARRADGWLPAVVIPGQFRPTAITGTMAELREAARQFGRDPDALGLVLRINPRAGTRLPDIADVVARARDEAGVDHVIVELTRLVDDADQALDLCRRLLERAA